MDKRKLVHVLIYLAVFVVITRLLLWKFYSFEGFFNAVSALYQNWKIPLMFLAGFFEALIILGLYFPGSSIILIGATLAGSGALGLHEVIIWSTLGLVCGYIVNYFAGIRGLSKLLDKAGMLDSVNNWKERAEKSNWIYFWSTFHPNFGALTSVAFGMLKVNFLKFLIIITLCQFFWSTFWGIIFFYFGMLFLKKISIVLGIIIVLMLAFEVSKLFRNKKAKVKALA